MLGVRSTMPNLPTEEELELAVTTVSKILARQNQEELGWIWSATSNSVNYSGQPENNKRIQARVDNAVGGVSIVYIFALLENYIPRGVWKYALPENVEKMYAYLHIRNTFAHGFDGFRAERYVDKFDSVMASDKPIPGIAYFDNEKIVVCPDVWQGLKKFISIFLSNILHRVINYGY